MSFFEDPWPMLSTVATAASAYVAYRLWRLQLAIERQKQPKVMIWYDRAREPMQAILTFTNMGSAPFFFKNLDIPNERADSKVRTIEGQKTLDFTIPAHSIQKFRIEWMTQEMLQFQLRFHFHDGSFEFLDIDTSFLGPYMPKKYTLPEHEKKFPR